MYEILDETLGALEAGRAFALVTLVADQGSTPRAAGAEMLVRADGSAVGSIGGGLLEHTMTQAAARALADRRSRLARAELTGTDVRSAGKMLCGGTAEVLITYVAPGDAALHGVCSALREARDAGRRAWYVTLLPAGEDGADGGVEHCALDAAGRSVGAAVCVAAEVHSLAGAAAHGVARLADGRNAVVERLDPPALAVVCGAGHVGRALSPVLLGLGFRVVVIDDREEYASPARFPGATVVARPFDGALKALGADERAYIVIVTRGHVHDMDVLEQSLRSEARYVGLMASRSKRAKMEAALREAGYDEDSIARIHSPIGLAIGAETPAELAVSIAAEMVLVRSGTRD